MNLKKYKNLDLTRLKKLIINSSVILLRRYYIPIKILN